jgi:nitrite reductase (NO-forming)
VTTTTTTTRTTTTTTTLPTGPIGTANTTVRVDMFEYRFDLSQQSIPSGQVTFVITNRGGEVHNFSIAGGRQGALLAPGASETWTVGLPAGGYNGVCDVPFHIERGMTTTFTVTP